MVKLTERALRAQGVPLAKGLNAAEAKLVQRTWQYQPLQSLHNLPVVPAGFKLILHADAV